MSELGDFEFERKFVVANGGSFPTENGNYVFQAFPYIGRECVIRARMEAAISSVTELKQRHNLSLHHTVDLVRLLADVHCTNSGLLTIKESGGGCSGVRYEKEMDISTEVVKSVLIELARRNLTSIIIKRRYSHIVSLNDRTWSWEIDVFEGTNAPLILAECEDAEPVSDLWIPKFCLREVTGDIKFTNAYLATHPFSTWVDQDAFLSGPTFSTEFGENTFERDM